MQLLCSVIARYLGSRCGAQYSVVKVGWRADGALVMVSSKFGWWHFRQLLRPVIASFLGSDFGA